jgi:plastocyanin
MLAACGGGSVGGGPTGVSGNNDSNNPPSTVTINMRTSQDGYGYVGDSSFDPKSQRLAKGGTVTWSNASGNIHNVTFEQVGAPSNVPDLPSGSASRTFNETGTFTYHCTNHAGMTGAIVVQ